MNELPNFINIGNDIFGDFFVPKSFASELRNPKILGSGGYGMVIGIESRHANKKGIAVKKYIQPFEHARRAQRCFREIQLLSSLDHENIVKMNLAYTTDESPSNLSAVYLSTELCGVDLGKLIGRETEIKHVFNLRSYQNMISQLLRALKYLNSANVMHRDLKPDNLAINDDGKLILIDFGLARVIDERNQMTRDPGTKYYRAIETIAFGENDRQAYNEKADIWSIGAILCEMLTGEVIFKHNHPILKALEICGPIPDHVLAEIDDEVSQKALRIRSEKATRIHFMKFFRQHGRPWLREDIEKEGEALVNFIDRTLAFDHRERMSVDDALSHSFLSSVRIREKEVVAGHSIPDVGDLSTEEWKYRIWNAIHGEIV